MYIINLNSEVMPTEQPWGTDKVHVPLNIRETKTVDDMKRRVEKDIWYIEHWSFWLDIQIMMKTITDVIHGDDKAY